MSLQAFFKKQNKEKKCNNQIVAAHVHLVKYFGITATEQRTPRVYSMTYLNSFCLLNFILLTLMFHLVPSSEKYTFAF